MWKENAHMSSDIPKGAYAIIIGAMKSGTSSLYDYLARHPAICPAIAKEPEFFSQYQTRVQVDNYNDLWPAFDSDRHRYVLEASTGYTKYPEETNVPRAIRDYGISPKFIYILRNPFDRILSQCKHLHYNDSLRLEPTDQRMVLRSNYFLQLQRYQEYFPIGEFLLLDFDDLKDCPDHLFRRTFQFLGLPVVSLKGATNVKNPTFRGSKIERALRKSRIGSVFSFLPGPIKKVGKSLLRTVDPPPERRLSEAERQFVHSELKDGMAELYRVYGFDVRKWGFDI
jgi:hypothetical protein